MKVLWLFNERYRVITVFVLVLSVVLSVFLDVEGTEVNEGLWTAFSFIYGAVSSVLAGYFGMKIATKANVRTANAAKKVWRSSCSCF